VSSTDSLRGDARGLKRRLVAGVGVLALSLAVLSAFVPVVGDVVAGSLGLVFGSPVIVVVAGLVGGGYGLAHLYLNGKRESTTAPLVGMTPERAHYPEHRVSGDDVDESVETVGGELPESSAKNWWTYRERNDVTSTLAELAVRVLANEHDVDADRAEELVASGAWTDDDRAAAFLGDDDAGALPLRVQFVDWLSGEAYQRRVTATVEAIARHAGVSTAATDDAVDEATVARTAGESALQTRGPTNVDERAATRSVPSTADAGAFEPATATDVSLADGSTTDAAGGAASTGEESAAAASDANATVLTEDSLATNGGEDT